MKIFTSAQIHELDKYTIEHEPIDSIDLMERAAKTLTAAIAEEWTKLTPVIVFAGPGVAGAIRNQFKKIAGTLTTGSSSGFGA